MKTNSCWKSGMGMLLAVLGLLTFSAQSVRADEGDPPTRVARISYTDGQVSFQPGGQGEWGTAQRNGTVTVGDKIWADKDSRAELQAGQASVHIASMTALSFLNLDDNTIQMRIAEGSINFRVRELREGDVYEVDAPNLAFTVKEAGAFRIDVSEDGESTRVTAIRGSGEVSAGGQSYPIRAGERGEFNGTQDVRYSVSPAPSPDSFDQWSQSRDLKEDNSVSAKYVSRDTVGYSDLDEYGTWDEVPQYGHVWYPTVVDTGWAPYSDGYWSYVGPWGWTWVDYAPWGYAPFHYGRWNYIGGRWGWCPGPYYARSYWSPAFVGFYGGRGWGVGFGFGFGGGVGWFPLGFGEPFCPWYRHSYGYARNINIYNTRITNVNIFNNRNFGNNYNYAYAHNPRAVSVMSRQNFVSGARVNRGAFHITDASLRGARVTDRVEGSPTRQSYFGANHGMGRVATPSAAIQNRSVVARNNPAPGASHMPTRSFHSGTFRAADNNSFRGGSGRPNGAINNGRGFENSANVGNRPRTSQPMSSGRFNNSPANGGAMSPRQRELSLDKPNSNMRSNAEGNAARGGFNNNSPRTGNNATRSWEAQGNATDRGRAPSGFGNNGANRPSNQSLGGNSNRPPNNSGMAGNARGTSMTHSDRPPWAGTGNAPRSDMQRANEGRFNGGNSNRPSNSGSVDRGANQRNYQPPQRNYSQRGPSSFNEGRSYSQPRSYNPPAQRSYSQPRYSAPPSRGNYGGGGGRSYSAPPSRGNSGGGGGGRSYSAPSHSSGGGGGSYHGGGGSSHGRH
ncbi:MAG: hypothetical protein JSS69_16080 [Acidobacteria bacterium]|nr:hypothetical protein [Acidobacteriota bacterium]MBS1867433.1 hypothetical protein [Acidobacteriota bacterium]